MVSKVNVKTCGVLLLKVHLHAKYVDGIILLRLVSGIS